MTNLPTLYARNSNGSVQQWNVHSANGEHWTIAGQVGGALVSHKPTKAKGKNIGRANETSPEKQADLEAQSKWDKKIKEGYHEDVANIDNFVFIQPMLAKEYFKRLDKVPYPVGVQVKMNGGRCVISKSGMFTRTGERILSCPHIEREHAALFVKYPDAVIDGELFGEGNKAKLNDTMSLIRRTVNLDAEHFAKSEAAVRFYVYDLYNAYGVKPEDFYLVRAEGVKEHCAETKYCVPVKTIICNNQDEVMAVYDELVAHGEEGAIVRLLKRGYDNKRSDALLKVKPVDDDEAVLLRILESKGLWSDTGKRVEMLWKGRTTKATLKGTYEETVQFLADFDTKWVNKEITFEYSGLTGLGLPNYARIDLNNCLKKV